MDIQLCDCLSRENILFEVGATSRDDALIRLVDQLAKTKDGFDEAAAGQALKEREAVLPTVIAPGVALPHARLDALEKPLVAIGTTRQGIVFDEDKDPVNLILLVLTPKIDPSAYLRILSMLSSILKDVDVPTFVSGATIDDIYELFKAEEKFVDYLTAGDVMNSEPITLLEGDTLNKAISTLCSRRVLDIPVVDEEGDLRGVIGMEDLLRQSLPQHLLWMEDLTPILRFEPFAEMMKKDQETKLADFMSEDYVSVPPDTPAVQLAKVFLMSQARQIQVLDGRKLVGVVDLGGFSTKLFWA
ncbi:MAG: PTS sugar transporter subunit IIA [Kiritimatiellales bacterium]|nr:PTS sugar transporter subunit IIA [Kiritimatiellota bacterium]MBL7011883.1 PTS sugar transporter subunit IIA [Kiritimatiellales bacterium]